MRQYLSGGQIAEILGVNRNTLRLWRNQFDEDTDNPCPAPDVRIDANYIGWDPSKVDAWRAWYTRHCDHRQTNKVRWAKT